MQKPTAIIDKSLLQRICEEAPIQRDVLMGLLRQRYQLIAAFVLVDEVMNNIAIPPPRKTPADFADLKICMDALYPCFMEDVWEMAFEELVLERRIDAIPWWPTEAIQTYASLNPNDPAFLETMQRRKKQRNDCEEETKECQNEDVPPGKFYVVREEIEFFHILVRDLKSRLREPRLKMNLFETLLGESFRQCHPEEGNRIQGAFARVSDTNMDSYPFTRNLLLVMRIYHYAPVSKILDQAQPPPILDRRDQLNNQEDLQYVASATLCDRLLTADQPMTRIMQMLKSNGFWRGETIWIDRDKDLPSQIPSLLA